MNLQATSKLAISPAAGFKCRPRQEDRWLLKDIQASLWKLIKRTLSTERNVCFAVLLKIDIQM